MSEPALDTAPRRQYFRMAKAASRRRAITTARVKNVPSEALASTPETNAVTLFPPTVETLPFSQDPHRPLSRRSQIEIWWEIRRLYVQLQALPCTHRPTGSYAVQSPAYDALVTKIHALSARYTQLDRAPLTLVRV